MDTVYCFGPKRLHPAVSHDQTYSKSQFEPKYIPITVNVKLNNISFMSLSNDM